MVKGPGLEHNVYEILPFSRDFVLRIWENEQKNRFLAFLTKIIASHKKTCKKKLVENFERNFLKKTVFRQIEYFLSNDVIMTSFLGVLGHFLVIFQNINLFSIEKCSLV